MRNRTLPRALRIVGAGFACFFLFASIAGAQEFRSTLTGEVTDPSGGAIPNARITAVMNDTQQTYTGKTDSSGIYFMPYVLPGLYTVTVKAAGFKTHVQEKVLLQASQSYGLNFKLQVGAVTQEVTVTAAPSQINTASGSSANVLTGREIENIPLNGRQIYMLLSTTPGSQFLQQQFGASGYSGTRGWDVSNNYSIGGGVQGYNSFTLNGTNITMMGGFGEEGSWTTAPSVDAIQEVNVMSHTYDAKYGHTAGGTMNIVTKSGNNRYHGDIFEYLENGALNANDFESNLAGLPTANKIQHQYGGTLGGPIKRDKLFFFASFEGYWQHIPFTTLTTVPPAYLHPQSGQGVDFTKTGFTIYNPLTTVCNSPGGTVGNCKNNNYSRQPFPNDTIPATTQVVNGVTIPGINATGAAILNYYPLPNTNINSLTNNYIARNPDAYDYYQPMGRVDYSLSDRTKMYSSFEWQKGHEYRDSSGFVGPAMRGDIHSMRMNIVASQDVTHVFSNTMVGDFKLSFTRYSQRFPDGNPVLPTPASIGLAMPHVGTASRDVLPEVSVADNEATIIGNSFSTQMNQTMVLDVDITKIHGAHSIEFGGELGRWNFANPFDVGHPNGNFGFGDGPTQNNPTNRGKTDGFGAASLLLGYPTSGGVDWQHTLYETIPEWAIYAQDNWRASRRLTLNIGLRYDVLGGVVDRFNGLNRGMCLTCVNPLTNNPVYQANITNPKNVAAWQAATQAIWSALGVTSGPAINPGTVYGGILFAGTSGQPRNAYNIDWGNLAPRIGFAYAINSKTVLRGGWGYVFAYGIEAGTRTGFAITTPYLSTGANTVDPSDLFRNGTPYPFGAQEPPDSSQGLLTNVGNGMTLDFPQRKIPRSTIMSFGIQRQLPHNTLLSVKYAGNYARALRTQGFHTWINQLPLDSGYYDLLQNNYNATLAGDLNAKVPNPFFGAVPVSTGIGNSATVIARNLLPALSQFGAGAVGDFTDPFGKSWYDSLQVKMDKRTGHGLSYQLAYTYSKNMQLTSYRNGWPWQDPHGIYEPIGYDRTHVFTLAGEWDLPIGKGSSFIFSNASGVWGKVVNNWRMDWIFSDSSGFPEYIPGGWHVSTHSMVPDGGPTFSQWVYNCNGQPQNCYTNQPSFSQGNQPDRVGYLRQPYIPNLDMTMQKEFQLTESKRLQFRWDAFNLMNTPLFPGPDTNTRDVICGPTTTPRCTQWSGFGTIRAFQNNFPRIMQVSLKLFF